MIRFEVPGDPVGKGRPRTVTLPNGRHMTHTPQATIDFENRVRFAAQSAGATPLEGPVELIVTAIFAMPKSRHRKREPRPAEWKTSVPDCDNVAKAVADALNGIAFSDDSQVAGLRVAKVVAAQGEPAKTVVTVLPLPPLGDG